MASNVDETFPADGEKVSKAEMRAQFLVIKEEIETLQRQTSVAGRAAYDNRPDRDEIESMIRVINNRSTRLAYQMATGLVSL